MFRPLPLILILATLPFARAQAPDPATLQGKVLMGYQGWFDCPQPGTPQTWSHWLRKPPSPTAPPQPVVDLYPDLSEFSPSDLCAVPGLTFAAGARPAYLFSAANPAIVARHFHWMKQYGLDGVLIQRFLSDIPRRRANGDVVLINILAAARAESRVFAIEYDVSGAHDPDFARIITDDWRYLVEDLLITAQPGYLQHNGKPVVSVWGLGFTGKHPPEDPQPAKDLIAWFHGNGAAKTPENFRATFMGGVPAYWRTLTRDARTIAAWAEVYAAMDVLQPWTVGRYGTVEAANEWKQSHLIPDLARAKTQRQLYMPVIFPGFSWANLNPGAKQNQIPRNGGEFLWQQAINAKAAGAAMLKVAMFDEVNEGTAIMKAAPTRGDAPDQGYWLTLDSDGRTLPNDWYLRLAGAITRIFQGTAQPTPKIPFRP